MLKRSFVSTVPERLVDRLRPTRLGCKRTRNAAHLREPIRRPVDASSTARVEALRAEMRRCYRMQVSDHERLLPLRPR